METDAASQPGSGRRWVRIALVCAVGVALAWSGRRALLIDMGRLLVREDAVRHAEVIVISTADIVADTLEAAHLYHDGVSGEIIVLTAPADPIDEAVRKLGAFRLPPAEYVRWLLERSGVPSGAVTVLPNVVDGTSEEIAELAAFAKQRRPASLLYIISRTHTARAAHMLTRALPPHTQVIVTSPRTDPFNPDAWWQSRADARELMTEYLRWVNTFVLGDLWAR